MDYRERGSHARGVYLTVLAQYTSNMGTARVKQEEETNKNNARVVRNLEERNMGTMERSPEQDLINDYEIIHITFTHWKINKLYFFSLVFIIKFEENSYIILFTKMDFQQYIYIYICYFSLAV